jgi:hypothetical protein
MKTLINDLVIRHWSQHKSLENVKWHKKRSLRNAGPIKVNKKERHLICDKKGKQINRSLVCLQSKCV